MNATSPPVDFHAVGTLHSARPGRLPLGSSAEYRDLALSPRVERLLRTLGERSHARHRIEGHFALPADQMGEPIVVRRALAFSLLLREMLVFIQDDELLVGGRTVYGAAHDQKADVFPGLTEVAGVTYFPTYTTPEEDASQVLPGGAASNHCVVGYGRVFELGLRGMRDYTASRRTALAEESDLTPEDRAHRLDFLRAVDICLEAVSGFARRYAALARQLAAEATSPERQDELAKIAAVCARVAEEPPTTFREALQLFLFVRIGSMVESYYCMPLGRFDQYLWPILEADLRASRTDRTRARELLECLFVKLNEEVDLSSADDCVRIMLGGQTSEGMDATNELSYMCLDVAVRLRLPSPKIGVRLHRAMPEKFFRRIVETIRLGIAGLPELYNDESLIPGLERFGIPHHHALDYCFDGCSEVMIPARSDFYPTWTQLQHLRVLTEALEEVSDDATWEELFAAYKLRLRAAIAAQVELGNAKDRALAVLSPAPFLSSTLEGCLERGLDKTWGGTLYNATGILGVQPVNTYNALAAIKQVVYEEGDVSLARLKTALASDFAGLEGERLRLRLRNRCSKFGNDDDRVDSIAAELAELFISEGQSHVNPRGGHYCPGFFEFAGFVSRVKDLGATPDGRRAGESVAGHLSPVGGTDRSGATAAIRSMSKVTQLHPPMGAMFDLRLHPSAVQGEAGGEKLGALLRAFMELDGKALQFNVVDGATLRAAQREPEKYRDLLVRVWGFSAYFVELSYDFQEHVINRTEHEL